MAMNIEKEKRAIQYLKTFEPQDEPYCLCYSGGKDSDVIKILAQLAGVKYEAVHNLTTVDAPETVYYVRSQKDVRIDKPEHTMWQLIEEKLMPPTRLVRYCCEKQKERGGKGRLKVTGVRWAESNGRKDNSGLVSIIGKPKTMIRQATEQELQFEVNKKGGLVLNDDNADTRKFVEQCYRTASFLVNPIVDWLDDEVWDFLRHYGCRSNPLYAEGYNRVGCVGCPMKGFCNMKNDFARWPKFKENYIRAFDRMIVRRKDRGLPTSWNSGEECFTWWVGDDPNQLSLFDMDDDSLFEAGIL